MRRRMGHRQQSPVLNKKVRGNGDSVNWVEFWMVSAVLYAKIWCGRTQKWKDISLGYLGFCVWIFYIAHIITWMYTSTCFKYYNRFNNIDHFILSHFDNFRSSSCSGAGGHSEQWIQREVVRRGEWLGEGYEKPDFWHGGKDADTVMKEGGHLFRWWPALSLWLWTNDRVFAFGMMIRKY